MRRSFTFAVGICIVVAASALDKSDRMDADHRSMKHGSGDFGQVVVENLTAEQRTVLQSKYRYWPASTQQAPRSPI